MTLNALSQVYVHHAALADEAKTVSFTVDRARDSGNRIRTSDDSANTTVEVKAVSLDEILPGEYAFGQAGYRGSRTARIVRCVDDACQAQSPRVAA